MATYEAFKDENRIMPDEPKSLFAGGIAHELNNLLIEIGDNIALEQSKREEKETKTSEQLNNAMTALLKALEITKQLLAPSKTAKHTQISKYNEGKSR